MWIGLLSLLVRSPDDVNQDIVRVLEHIESRDLLPPVAVIEIMSTNEKIELRTVREYVLRMLRRDTEKVSKHRKEIKETSERIEKMRAEVKELQTTATIFQTNRCAHCSAQLDVPAVFFLCKHSFHQRCLENERQCNICLAEKERICQLQRELDERVNDSAEFFRVLGDQGDGFSVVAQFFGRGIFSAADLKKEASLIDGEGTFDALGVASAAAGEEDVDDDDGDDGGRNIFADELANPEELEAW
jgi:hypothetical protein